jgi:hypothetical protein
MCDPALDDPAQDASAWRDALTRLKHAAKAKLSHPHLRTIVMCTLALAGGGYLWTLSTSNTVAGSFALNTTGSSGKFVGNSWEVSLPLVVENGLDYPIHQVEMMVELFSCASPQTKIDQCEHITTFSEIYMQDVLPRSRVRQVHHRSGAGAPRAGTKGHGILKVRSELFSMVDAKSLEAQAEQERLESLRFP